MPYIPVDPADLGRTYDSVIRVNSQSGKGGIAYLLERDYGVVMPRRMQVEFSALVQREMDSSETEMTSQQLWALFEATYLATDFEVTYHAHHLFEEGDKQGIELEVTVAGTRRKLRGVGSGPIAATVAALALPIRIDNYEERALRVGRRCLGAGDRRSRARWRGGHSLRRRPPREHRDGVGARGVVGGAPARRQRASTTSQSSPR